MLRRWEFGIRRFFVSDHWPFLQSTRDIHVTGAEGAYLFTKNGPLLDAAGGAIVVNVGHGRQEVADAVGKATAQSSYVVPPWLTDERVALVERLREDWLPESLSRLHMTSGGSEAVESAMKIAIMHHASRGQPEKCRIIGRSISYHGTTLATTAVGGHEARKVGIAHVLNPHPVVATPYVLRCPDTDPLGYFVEELEKTIASEGAETIAALLAEPITGSSGGAIVPPDGYWEAVRRICDENDVLLIMDEVMTGFGRTGTDFGYQHWPIEPDILIAGKGLAGGYAPLVGVFATERVAQPIAEHGYHVMFHTFGAHPAACAAAATVLTILRREKLVERSRKLGERLHERLTSAFSNHPHVAEVRGRGLLQAIEIVRDRDTLDPFPVEDSVSGRVVGEGLKRGIFFYGGGTGVVRDIVCMGPPFVIEETDIDRMAETLLECVDTITA